VGLLEAIRSTLFAGAVAEQDRQRTLNALARGGGGTDDKERLERYATYEGYYDGRLGRAKLTGRLKAYLERDGFGYVENFSETLVDALALCLELSGMTSEDDALNEWLVEAWEANRLDDTQGVLHTQVPMQGDGYIIVDWNPETELPRFTYNRPALHRPVYDEHGRMILDAKCWPEGGSRRLNLYFPDRVEKWITASSDAGADESIWTPHHDPTDVDEQGENRWPTPWVDAAGDPLGIPVFHMRNKPKGRDFGRSELHSVIPQIIYLTKQLTDLAEILDYQGAGQTWASGVGDATFVASAGTVWKTKNEGARFGRFDPVNPQGTLEAIEQTMRRIAARSQTPLHQLMTGGVNPTGETQRAANAPLYRKAHDRETSFGGVWADAWRMAIRLQQLHVPAFKVPDDFKVNASWTPPDSNDPQGDLDAAEAKLRIGVSKATVLSELGYDAEKEAELRKDDEAASAQALADAFKRGETDVTPPAPAVQP
jgi:hypothetical protein